MPSQTVIRGLIGLLLLFVGGAAGAAPVAVKGEATIEYISGGRIYLDAGLRDGVRPGDAFWLLQGGKPAARGSIVEVNDHAATAVLRDIDVSPRIGDRIRYQPHGEAQTPPSRNEPTVSDHPGTPWRDDALAVVWTASLEANPPQMVRYAPTGDDTARISIAGRGETEYRLYSNFSNSAYTRNEQRFSFWMSGDPLGVEGLGVRIGGSVYARYDNGPDLYLPERRAYPLIRDAALTYEPQDHPFFGVLGRFTPRAPIAHTIDGMEAGFETGRVTASLFGGLKPSERDLVPTLHHQTLGSAVTLLPIDGEWRYEATGAVVAEMRDGRFCRTALGLDNRVNRKDRFRLSETATFDFIGADDQGDPKADFAVTLLAVDSGVRLTDHEELDFRARYDERALFAEDVETYREEWLAAMRGARHGEVVLGVSHVTRKQNTLRPFVFTRGDLDKNGVDKGYSGAGITYRDPTIFGGRSGFSTTVDYGFGTGQLANIDVAFDTPFWKDRLRLLSGLFTTWSFADNSDVHTLRHYLYCLLSGRVRTGLELFANLQASYDHALVRLTYPFGGWLQLHLGASYAW